MPARTGPTLINSLGPYFPAVWILRKIQARKPVDSFTWRHPLISLAGLILVCGFIIDAFLEISMIRTGLYIYDQVIPFGSVFTGTPFQFPLLWESLSVTFAMIPAGVLLNVTVELSPVMMLPLASSTSTVIGERDWPAVLPDTLLAKTSCVAAPTGPEGVIVKLAVCADVSDPSVTDN